MAILQKRTMSFIPLSFTFFSLLMMWDCLFLLHELHFPVQLRISIFDCSGLQPPEASQSINISNLHIYPIMPTGFSGQTDPYENVFSVVISVASLLAQKKNRKKATG